MVVYRIKPLPIVEIEASMGIITYLRNYNRTMKWKGYIWYIDGAKENIIVDSSGKAKTLVEHDLPATQIQTPREALSNIGLSPEEVDKVIVTHAHFDHIEYGKDFPNAVFLIQKNEIELARNPHPAVRRLYMDVIPLFDELRFQIVDGEKEILEGISVILTPGHTPGSQSVVVETEKGKAVITGFCSTKDNFESGVITPGVHVDVLKAYDSVVAVKQIADILLPLHEPNLKDTIP